MHGLNGRPVPYTQPHPYKLTGQLALLASRRPSHNATKTVSARARRVRACVRSVKETEAEEDDRLDSFGDWLEAQVRASPCVRVRACVLESVRLSARAPA